MSYNLLLFNKYVPLVNRENPYPESHHGPSHSSSNNPCFSISNWNGRRRRIILLVSLAFVFLILFITVFVENDSWERFMVRFGGYFMDDTSLEATNEQTLLAEQITVERTQGEILPRTSNRDYHNMTLEAKTQYFIYSPSGGFNNQRIELEYALMICRILNRVLIVPPMGKHSSFYGRYELLTPAQMVPMDKIFDFETIARFNPAIPLGNQKVVAFVQSLINRGYDVKTIFHQERIGWKEADVYAYLVPITSKVLFLRGAEMYHQWDFNVNLAHQMYTTIRFTQGIRQVAMNVIDEFFNSTNREYSAIHVRMGDYADRTPPISDFKRKMERRNFRMDIPLYIATEPNSNKQLFRDLCNIYDCKFSKDFMDSTILRKFAEAVPQGQIRQDMIGVVEQLICVAAKRFVGTSFSTFSAKIVEMRKFRSFAFPEFGDVETSNKRNNSDETDVRKKNGDSGQ